MCIRDRVGHRRYARHWSVPDICAELRDAHHIVFSPDTIENYVRRYERMVAARHLDSAELVDAYANIPDLVLAIDGLQPEKGHETLYVVRELNAPRIWFAVPLLSSTAAEIEALLVRARDIAATLRKPVRAWVSDKQDAFVSGIPRKGGPCCSPNSSSATPPCHSQASGRCPRLLAGR